MKFLKHIVPTSFVLFLPLVASAQGSYVGFGNPIKAGSVCEALKVFLNALLTFVMPIAVLFLVYAGFQLVFARGNPKGLQTAKRNLLYVIIGIVIFMGAWVIGQVIANTLSSVGSQAGYTGTEIGSCSPSPAQQLQNGTIPL